MYNTNNSNRLARKAGQIGVCQKLNMNEYLCESITDLFDFLSKSEFSSKLTLKNEIIEINFHKNFKMEICFSKNQGLFLVYINTFFYYGIEPLDISEFFLTLSEYVVIQHKKIPFWGQVLKIVSKKTFNKVKWQKRNNVMIFDMNDLILNNYVK